ncbi:hypothetical protein HQ576_01520 [bacterium]|nr:hypothetical protein [bacterium]
MTQAIETYEGVVVPEPVLVKVQRKDRYGSVPGLSEEELADPEELERQVLREEWRPILALPNPKRTGDIRPAVDESGGVDWGAFGTVDFERYRGSIDRSKSRVRELRERLKDRLILLGIVKGRLPGKAKYLVLRCLKMGIVDLDHITNDDMLVAARLYLEARTLQQRIWKTEEASRKWKAREMEEWIGVE